MSFNEIMSVIRCDYVCVVRLDSGCDDCDYVSDCANLNGSVNLRV